MMQQPKDAHIPPKHKKSKVLLFIEIVVLLAILCAVGVSLIYYFGAQQIHSDVPHALDQIFGTKPHKDLITDLNKKSYQNAIVYANNETGIFQFLEHYADLRASKGGLVIVKRVQNNLYETALKFIRYTKEYIEDAMNLQNQLEKVEWIFIVRNGQPPLDQLQKIRTKRPKDRIVVGLTAKKNINGFKAIKFPTVPIQVVQDVIKADFGVTSKQASILTNYYGTIPEILSHLNEISYTHEKHLGTNYQNLKDLGKVQLKTLKALCSKGVAPLQGNRAALEEVGVVTFDGKVYWQQRINRLNFQLSQQIQCVDKLVPPAIKQRIQRQRQQQSKLQIQGQEQPAPVQTQQKQQPNQKSSKKQKTNQKPNQKTTNKAASKAKVTKVQKSSKPKQKKKQKL